MIYKLITIIKFIFFKFISSIRKRNSPIIPKSLLLIRIDAIGDYVLFRNFIKILKKSDKYKDYTITLLGNSAWKSLSEQLDKEYIDNFIWLDRKKFHSNPLYRYKFLSNLARHGFEVLISPVYSRDFLFVDCVVNVASAQEKIGSIGDLSNIKKWQKNISDRFYTKLIHAEKKLMFEFDRNKEFFEKLLNTPIALSKPTIKLSSVEPRFDLPGKYAVLFIGASSPFRKWNMECFAKVAYFLQSRGYEIVLCGAKSDMPDVQRFASLYQNSFLNLVGKTSLFELLQVISDASLMISNETSAPHFAIALDTITVFVISNGNHFGRFTPYPKNMTKNYHAIYHPVIVLNLDNYEKLSNSYGYGSKLDINEITSEMVIKAISPHIDS